MVVTMNADGTPAATRVEEGVLLTRPKPEALAPVLAAMPAITVNEKDISETRGDKGFLGSMFGTPTFEGGEAPKAPSAPPAGVPKASPPPAKAVVPAGAVVCSVSLSCSLARSFSLSLSLSLALSLSLSLSTLIYTMM